jgi:hypothetical protein
MRLVRHAIALVFFSSLAFAVNGKITGTLLDENGVPVPQMGVQAHPIDIGFDGASPVATTDNHGKFAITIRGLQKVGSEHWSVYPYDVRKGFYPRPSGFYGNDVPAPITVELSPQFPDATVEVRLGRKVGALNVRVGGTGSAIQPTFVFSRMDASNKMTVTFSGAKDSYRILLPANTNLTLDVTSPGYRPLSYARAISVGSGQEGTLDIELELEGKDEPSQK